MIINSLRLKKIVGALAMLMLLMSLLMPSVSAETSHQLTDEATYAGEPCPPSGVWPDGCMPGGGGGNGNACPESGVWPPGCDPNGGGGGNPAPPPAAGEPCPPSGPWPPNCDPNAGGGGSPAPPPAAGEPCPPSGPWPDGCDPNGGGGTPPPPPPPAPNPDPAPDPMPEPPAEEEPEVLGFITIVYASNPDEVLGVFPVVLFDAELMYSRMLVNQQALNEMRDSLSGMLGGDQAACDRYETAYERIKEKGIFFVDIPGDWQNLDAIYFFTFVHALDRTRPAYLSCFDSGRVDQFNHDLAFQTILEALDLLNPAIEEAAGKLGK